MSQWGWTPARNLGIWRHGAGWLRPFAASVPYLTVVLLLVQLFFVSGTLTAEKGVLFDLPAVTPSDGAKADFVALVLPVAHETAVFFDETRYGTGEPQGLKGFGGSLADAVRRTKGRTLLLLADRRVSAGVLMELVSVARASGVARVLVAARREKEAEP